MESVTTYIALLRGINVGKAKRVPMAALRELLGDLGYTAVATLLNSGNVVFRASQGTALQHSTSIAQAIATTLKLEVPVIVKSARDLHAIVAENPLAKQGREPSRLLVSFVQGKRALSGLSAITALVTPPDLGAVGKQAAYFYCPNGVLESKAGKAMLGKAGQAATSRNWATVLKLQALASEVDRD